MNVIQLKNGARLRGESSIVVDAQTVGPEDATRWLECNQHNRPLRKSHVAFLASEILNGNWQLNGQGIVIGDDEQVLDGQHRLHAIIMAGRPVKTLVVYGISRDAFKTIDTGAVRTGSDALALWHPEENASWRKAVAGAVPWCERIESGFHGGRRKISNTEILGYCVAHSSLWRCVEILSGYPTHARPLSLAQGTALFEMFQRKNPETAESFMRALFTGEQLEITDPEYILRELLHRDAKRLSNYPAEVKMKMAVKAWNLRRRGRDKTTRQAVAFGPREPDSLHAL